MADRISANMPGIAILFISGYTQEALTDRGRLKPGVSLLSKPFTRRQLALKVREVLDVAVERRDA
jgi:hypothetical protein